MSTSPKLLIANRGEIAVRIAQAARRAGIPSVAVYSDADRNSYHVNACDEAVHIGAADSASSYLSVARLVEAARTSGATLVHPGYGFLAENSEFARAVQEAGLSWVGPSPEAIEQMGSKIEARKLAAAAGVPIIPGFDRSQDPEDLRKAAREIGYPVMVKASAGGGGKGIRIAHTPEDFDLSLRDAKEEARRSFGDDAVIVERYITQPRHIEVQIVGDRHGHLIHLGTRECSLQRRHQKVIEEAPAQNLSEQTRKELHDAALTLSQSIAYDNAGTVEFILDDDSGEFFFLEINTRLQVEHPVTELVTNVDLVDLQLRIAAGDVLPLEQSQIAWTGHAIEARLNAEDPWNGFMPQIGTIAELRIPEAIRWDSGVVAGSEVSPHYDSMLAKLISWGDDRERARRNLLAGLESLHIAGPRTNQGFLRWLLLHPRVIEGRVTTRFLDEEPLPSVPVADSCAPAAALGYLAALDQQASSEATPWRALGLARFTPHVAPRVVSLSTEDGRFDIAVSGSNGAYEIAGARYAARWGDGRLTLESDGRREMLPLELVADQISIQREGHTQSFRVVSREERWLGGEGGGSAADAALQAPFPGLVTAVEVEPGAAVKEGDVLVVLEAMKMLHSLAASGSGRVAEVFVKAGMNVESGSVLVTFEDDPADC